MSYFFIHHCSNCSQPKSCWKARNSFISFLELLRKVGTWLILFRHPYSFADYKDKLPIEIPHLLSFDSFVAHWGIWRIFFFLVTIALQNVDWCTSGETLFLVQTLYILCCRIFSDLARCRFSWKHGEFSKNTVTP